MLNACRQLRFQDNELIKESKTNKGEKKLEVFKSQNLHVLANFNPAKKKKKIALNSFYECFIYLYTTTIITAKRKLIIISFEGGT